MALSCACHFGVTFGYWAISQARRSLPRSPPQKSICWNILHRRAPLNQADRIAMQGVWAGTRTQCLDRVPGVEWSTTSTGKNYAI